MDPTLDLYGDIFLVVALAAFVAVFVWLRKHPSSASGDQAASYCDGSDPFMRHPGAVGAPGPGNVWGTFAGLTDED
jgi:hypothetical protein